MRIIAGKFKGKKLNTPSEKNTKIRPTLDRIKEPMFSILMPYLKNAKVLDLFAGTGSLGLEAISRGASFVHLNDINKEALGVISSNIQLTVGSKYARISRKEYQKCLKSLSSNNEKFDIIFLDPPYELGYEENCLKLISDYELLSSDGVIVLESDKIKSFPENVANFKQIDKRTYGRVTLRLYSWR